MRVSSVTFSIANTMPLIQFSGKPDDQYSNIKPMTSVTVDLAEGDSVEDAVQLAKDTAFGELQKFRQEFRELYRGKKDSKT